MKIKITGQMLLDVLRDHGADSYVGREATADVFIKGRFDLDKIAEALNKVIGHED